MEAALKVGAELKVGVIGVGHFGRYHALKVAAAARAQLVGVHDTDADRARVVAEEAGCPMLAAQALIESADAVIVATPADLHFEVAARALAAGRHVLVEKPIASSIEQAERLAALARRNGRVLQVGHLERFSAAHGAIAGRMDRPVYIEAVRIAPFKPRGTDVSVILDLMIHDLDLILALVAQPIDHVDAVGAPIASLNDDIANARVRFVDGCVATITASRISLKTERKMRIFAEAGYLTVDFAARRLARIARGHGAPLPGFAEFGIEQTTWQDHDSLAAEHDAFYAACLDGAPVLVDAAAGTRALEAALAVSRSIAHSRAIAESSGLIRAAALVEG